MARGTGSTVDVKAPAASAAATEKTPATGKAPKTAPHRHAGPWGASFDGTEPDGKTRAKGLTFERRWTRPGVHPYD